jgi:hypothetical protein
MKNRYLHLENNVTVIYCTKSSDNRTYEVYIDTDDFEKVNSIEDDWRIWKSGQHLVPATSKGDKTIYLHRFIMEVPTGKAVIRANGDVLDIRKENILIIGNGEANKPEVQQKLKELREKLPPIPTVKRVDANDPHRLHPVVTTKIFKDMLTNQIIVQHGNKTATLESISDEDALKLAELLA